MSERKQCTPPIKPTVLINQAEQKYLNEDHEQKTVKLMSRGKCAPATLLHAFGKNETTQKNSKMEVKRRSGRKHIER